LGRAASGKGPGGRAGHRMGKTKYEWRGQEFTFIAGYGQITLGTVRLRGGRQAGRPRRSFCRLSVEDGMVFRFLRESRAWAEHRGGKKHSISFCGRKGFSSEERMSIQPVC